jgi:hypothetical protein
MNTILNDVTAMIGLGLFITLCYYVLIGYIVPMPPVWWNVL